MNLPGFLAEPSVPSAAHEETDSRIVCVLTRFRVRRPWHLVQTYLAHRWLIGRVRRVGPPGLLKSVFLVENSTAFYSLSLWTDEAAIPMFGTAVQEHVSVAREIFGRLRISSGHPEIWSTKWRLHEVSNNLNWEGFDLRAMLDLERVGA